MRLNRLLFLLLTLICIQLHAQTPAQLAQQQLDAYNARDIEAFLAPYSDTVKIFNHPNTLIASGKEKMRGMYEDFFKNTPELHCTLLNRITLGNVVIDQEYVVFSSKRPPAEVIAHYKISNKKIVEVYFIRPEIKDNK